jgi:hypothetical protein
VEYRSPELDYAGENFGRFFEDDDLLSCDQGDERIWGLFDALDEIGIDQQGLVVQTCELNHDVALSWRCAETHGP